MRAALILAVLCAAPVGGAVHPETFEEIRALRLRGELDRARALAEETLEASGLTSDERIDLHLELFRIHDRVGLHHNSRPVAQALRHIEAAFAVTEDPSPSTEARLELARAGYHYRAETAESGYPVARAHAERALALFQELGDTRGQADAVHRLGLFHMQRRELEDARELFDRSLELEKKGEERLVFLADYERHVGFVYVLGEDIASSIPYFERSLTLRREAGAVDQSLFAARVLGWALVEVGRLEEARASLLYGMLVAERLDSPVGRSRLGLPLGALYEKLGETDAARLAYEATLAAAESVGYASYVERATAALDRLAHPATH